MTRFIKVTEPSSGERLVLETKPINNAPYPGWLVLISGGRNIWIYRQDGDWKIYPDVISNDLMREIAFQLQNQLFIEEAEVNKKQYLRKRKVVRHKRL